MKPTFIKMMLLILRWLSFFPLGLIGVEILNFLAYVGYKYCSVVPFHFTLLNVVLAIMVASLLTMIIPLWFMLVVMIPMSCVHYLAPRPRVAAAIFILLFSSFELHFLIQEWAFLGRLHVGFEVLFSGFVVAGALSGATKQPLEQIISP